MFFQSWQTMQTLFSMYLYHLSNYSLVRTAQIVAVLITVFIAFVKQVDEHPNFVNLFGSCNLASKRPVGGGGRDRRV